MRDIPLNYQKEYAVEDADITFQLKEHFVEELTKGNVSQLFKTI